SQLNVSGNITDIPCDKKISPIQNQDGNSQLLLDANGSMNSSTSVARDACFRCGRPGHTSRECTYKDQRICFVCGGVGHVAKNCPAKPKQKDEKKQTADKKK
ncbi:MAG: hypothetical protein EZS28_042958, partial [Streblomastix strix]